MIKILIRKVKFLDLKYMSELNKRNLTENYDFDYWVRIFNDSEGNKHSFVAVYSSQIIGYIFGDKENIISFAIDEPFRKFGIGRQLLAHSLNTYTNDVLLHVKKTNDIARNLYKNFNFDEIKVLQEYYISEDGIEMIHKYGKKYLEKSKFNIPYKKLKIKN